MCDTTRAWHNREEITSTRRTALRDKAMILLLVDTGVRASELCRLTLANIDRITGHVEILKGKGGKSRTVRAERSTVRAIWRYLDTRPEDLPDSAPLFASTADDDQEEEKFLSRFAVLRLLKRLGERAKVKDVNIQSFATPLPSSTCATAATSIPCRSCSATARWTWCAAT